LVSDGKTILMVTHDDDLAGRASRTIRISDGLIVDKELRFYS
jgi:ABC-type lipoprotein export system ATPase subunit